MKILAVTDEVVDIIYSPLIQDRFGDVDVVLGCGDLPYSYMEYIVSMLNVPAYFVHGNHDCDEHTSAGRLLTSPGGWVDLDARSAVIDDLILAGLEGSIRYRPNAPYQYNELQMMMKITLMLPSLLRNRLQYGRYVDMLIAHSPPFGINDGTDRAHRGFKSFLWFMERFRPTYLLHGHKHLYGLEKGQGEYQDTSVVNVFPYQTLEW